MGKTMGFFSHVAGGVVRVLIGMEMIRVLKLECEDSFP